MLTRLKALNWAGYAVVGLLGYIIWFQFLLPYKAAVERHEGFINTWVNSVNINPDGTVSWKNPPKPAPQPPAEAKKK